MGKPLNTPTSHRQPNRRHLGLTRSLAQPAFWHAIAPSRIIASSPGPHRSACAELAGPDLLRGLRLRLCPLAHAERIHALAHQHSHPNRWVHAVTSRCFANSTTRLRATGPAQRFAHAVSSHPASRAPSPAQQQTRLYDMEVMLSMSHVEGSAFQRHGPLTTSTYSLTDSKFPQDSRNQGP